MRKTIRRVAPGVAVVMIIAALTAVTDTGASAGSQAAVVAPSGPRLSFPQATLDAIKAATIRRAANGDFESQELMKAHPTFFGKQPRLKASDAS
jgi:hypothetical protein